MTHEEKKYIAQVLMTSHLLGEDKILPVVYVVNGRPYWFYYAALRAAGNEPRRIEIMTADEAYTILTGLPANTMRHNMVTQDLDQRGHLFGGYLYCDEEVKPQFIV